MRHAPRTVRRRAPTVAPQLRCYPLQMANIDPSTVLPVNRVVTALRFIGKDGHEEVIATVRGWLDRLVPQPADLDTWVWHYTRPESLIKMVESGTIFATQVSCLNDSSEVIYASRLLRRALEGLLESISLEPATKAFAVRFVQALEENVETPNHAHNMFFVSCFSQLEDDLGQWRSYAGGENGVALGFRLRMLIDNPSSYVGAVNYDSELHETLAKEVAQTTLDFYTKLRARQTTDSVAEFDDAFLAYWDEQVQVLAPFVKDRGFSSEQEVRIVHPYTLEELQKVVILPRRTMMSRHLPLALPGGLVHGRQYLPFEQLMIGPGRHKQTSLVSASLLLEKHGYTWVTFRKSVRPYQEP
jgi:Protein of unknown function (DUF2971)